MTIALRRLAFAVGILIALPAIAAPTFPTLSGRVVDEAGIIPADIAARIEAKLATLEEKTTNQFVVATVKSLEGYDIRDYGYQLGRAWGIGQKEKDNGLVLLIAPNERKVSFEVGYGLEGTLTDALTRVIIENAILPRFRDNDMAGGIERGVDDAIQVISGDATEIQKLAEKRPSDGGFWNSFLPVLFFIIVIIVINVLRRGRRGGALGTIRNGCRVGHRSLVGQRRFVRQKRRLLGRRRVVRRWRFVGELVMATTPAFSNADRIRIREAIAAAEAKTSGEIFVVVAESSDDYRFIPLLWATLAALLVPLPLIFLTLIPASLIYLVQLLVFVVLAIGFAHPLVAMNLVPPGVKHARARALAVQQFLAHGLHTTEARTGVLVFLSLAERHAEIIADASISAKVGDAVWKEAMDKLIAEIKAGRLADGLAATIESMGTILAKNFPRRLNDKDELSNDLVLL